MGCDYTGYADFRNRGEIVDFQVLQLGYTTFCLSVYDKDVRIIFPENELFIITFGIFVFFIHEIEKF